MFRGHGQMCIRDSAGEEEPSEQAEAKKPAEETPTKSTQEDDGEAAVEEN